MLSYSVLLLPLPSPCMGFCDMDEDDLGESLWSRFASEAVFLPVSQREAFAALLTQSEELAGVFRYFKRRYVSSTGIFSSHYSPSVSHSQ